MQTFNDYFLNFLPHLLPGLAILIIGIIFAQVLKKVTRKWIHQYGDHTLWSFIVNFSYIVILLLIILMTLSKLGIPTTSLVTVLGAASLAIGFALRDFLSNVAAGFMIIFLRPFKVGDYINVTDGEGRVSEGTVTDVHIFMTQLKTRSNEALFIPNSNAMNSHLINMTYYPTYRIKINVSVSYDTDIPQAKALLKQILSDCPRVFAEPPAWIVVEDLGDSAVILKVRASVKSSEFRIARYELFEIIKQQFNQHQITIAFPQTDVHLKYDL